MHKVKDRAAKIRVPRIKKKINFSRRARRRRRAKKEFRSKGSGA
jgi:hypothetical protein